MALHGHTRLELTDVNTGRTQTVEHDNLITNAVNRIFSTFPEFSYVGKILYTASESSYTWYSMWEKFYGGLLLYDTALTEDADNFFAPAGVGLTGTARYGLVNGGVNTVRGSYNVTESSLDYANREIRLVYDFTTSQANGTIAAVCLTNAESGLLGGSPAACAAVEKRRANLMDSFWSGGSYTMFPTALDPRNARSAYGMPFLLDLDTDTLWLARLVISDSQKSLMIYTADAQLRSISLLQKCGSMRSLKFQLVQTIDLSGVVLSTFSSHNRVEYDHEKDVLNVVCCAADSISNGRKINILQVDRKTFAATAYTFTNTMSVSFTGLIDASDTTARLPGLVYQDRLYLRDSSYELYSVPLEDPTDVQVLRRNGFSPYYVQDFHHGKIYCMDTSRGYVLDTATGEVLANELATEAAKYGIVAVAPTSPVVMSYTAQGGICPAVRQPFLSSINNLPSPVVKSASQTMKITYTLREGAE